MIRRRNKAGFRYLNKSYQADRVSAVPAIDDLASLVEQNWWAGPATASDFCRAHDGGSPPVVTKLRIVYDDQFLFAAFYMQEPEISRTNTCIVQPGVRQIKPVDPVSGKVPLAYDIEKDDSAQLLLDLSHGHGRFVRFFTNMAGVGYAVQAEGRYTSEAVYPRNIFSETWARPYDCKVVVDETYWLAAWRIPWSSLDVNPAEATVLGLNAVRGRTVREWNYYHLSFGPQFGGNYNAGDFADLYMGSSSIALDEVDFGRPVLDENRMTASIRNTTGEELSLTCRARVVVDRSGQVVSDQSADLALPPDGRGQVELGYTLDWREDRRQTLTLTIARADDGRVLLTGPYFFAYNQDIPAEQRYRFDDPQDDPASGDEDFIVKKRYYLLSRIPHFSRATTRDGAPSDFTLRSDCGKYEFDLMQPGALKKIATMIEDIFTDPKDRLAAATLLAHQKAFSMHLSPHVALHGQITPLSALRLNAGHCYSRALVWLGIARNISAGDGRGPYGDRAHCILVLHHVMGCIDVGHDDRWMFDPTPGSFFYAWDNTRFATEKELERDPALAARMLRTRPSNFTLTRYHRAIPAGQIVFPQGAVAD